MREATWQILRGLEGRDFLKLLDYTPEEVDALVELAAALKKNRDTWSTRGGCAPLSGRQVALIFEKTSTRTRCAFEVAARELGMGATYLDPSGSQIGKKESIADTARVLSEMFDGIEYRGFGQTIVEDLAKYASVPVWNGLTDDFHPTQMLADLLTIRECFGSEKGRILTFYGDCRFNMANSWMAAGALTGMHIRLSSDPSYFPDPALTEQCRAIARENGGSIELMEDPRAAARGAHVLYTDVWVSMGEPEAVWEERLKLFKPYQVSSDLMALADEKAVFMHCLPAYHDLGTQVGRMVNEKFGLSELEVTDAVFEGPQSVVFREAGNRMHTIKAVMAATLGARFE